MKTKKKTISPEALAAADRQRQEVRSAFGGVARRGGKHAKQAAAESTNDPGERTT